ncbi:MAG: NAD(P)-dependent oxidoreductase [Dehalococcoidia bacterium]|nr:NAD(P)-dependent oxidoreductase [Dehalococcoidia bacterium]
MKLKGKKALVTAAGQGIGRATAELFAENGAEVYACDINQDTLNTLNGMTTIRADVTKKEDINNLYETTGGVDILFNGVGFVHGGTILECDDDQWDEAFEINVKSMFRISKKYLPYMIDQNYGSIINMSSVASSLAGVVNRFSYSSSKAAIIGLTKSIAKDFVGNGIRCNAIAPATVESPSLQDRINAETDPVQAKKDFIARQPMGRLGQPEEIANLALYLASDNSKYTTGVAHIIDGGMII